MRGVVCAFCAVFMTTVATYADGAVGGVVGYVCSSATEPPKVMRVFVDYGHDRIGYSPGSLYVAAKIDEKSVGWQDISTTYSLDRLTMQLLVVPHAAKPDAAPPVPLQCQSAQ